MPAFWVLMNVAGALQHPALEGHHGGCAHGVSNELQLALQNLQTPQEQQSDSSVARVAAEAAMHMMLCMEHQRQQKHTAHDRKQGLGQALCLVHPPAAAAAAAAAVLPQLLAPGQSQQSAPRLEGAGAPRTRVGWECQELHAPAFLSTSCKPNSERLDLQG